MEHKRSSHANKSMACPGFGGVFSPLSVTCPITLSPDLAPCRSMRGFQSSITSPWNPSPDLALGGSMGLSCTKSKSSSLLLDSVQFSSFKSKLLKEVAQVLTGLGRKIFRGGRFWRTFSNCFFLMLDYSKLLLPVERE